MRVTPMGVESTVLDLTQSPPAILRPGAEAAKIGEGVREVRLAGASR